MAADKEILVEIEGGTATLAINRPDTRNSLSAGALRMIASELEKLGSDSAVRCIIVTGNGDEAFCSGYDIKAISDEDIYRRENHPLTQAMRAVRNCPLPVVAMINGHAFGAGLELAVACDIRISADDAKFAMPPAKLGVTYSYEGIKKFLNLIGPGLTRELFLTARPITARRALENGLVNHLVKKEKLGEFVRSATESIIENAPLSMISMKKMMNIWEEKQTLSESERAVLESLIREVCGSRDYREGRKAFMEKRKPVFRGE